MSGEWLVAGGEWRVAICWKLLDGVKFEMRRGECMVGHGFYSLTSVA